MENSTELHPSFKKLHEKLGSGYYLFSTKIGMGSIFYLSSTAVISYNPTDGPPRLVYYDFYDALRAVEEGYVVKLVNGPSVRSGEVTPEVTDREERTQSGEFD